MSRILPDLFAGWSVSPHRFDLFAQPRADELTPVEAPNHAVAGGQRRLILLHPALPHLAAVLSMADQGLDA